MIDKFIELGFSLVSERVNIPFTSEYKYYPYYLKDSHFTLVCFGHGETTFTDNTDYRLYINYNDGGGFAKCLFQLSRSNQWNRDHMDQIFSDLFKLELREVKLNSILG
jgi:hypothetical protein